MSVCLQETHGGASVTLFIYRFLFEHLLTGFVWEVRWRILMGPFWTLAKDQKRPIFNIFLITFCIFSLDCGAGSVFSFFMQSSSLCVSVQDEAQYVCVVEIEGVQFNLTAAVEKTQDSTHTFTCSPHQVTHTLTCFCRLC